MRRVSKIFVLILSLIMLATLAHGQNDPYADFQNRIINGEMRTKAKMHFLDSVAAEFKQKNDVRGLLKVQNYRALLFDELGILDSAMNCAVWVKSHFFFKQGRDSVDLMQNQNVFAALNLSLHENNKAIEAADAGLNMWNAEWSNDPLNRRIYFNLYTNKAIANAYNGSLDMAEESFNAIQSEAIVYKDTTYIEKSLINLGTLAAMTQNFDRAKSCFLEALRLAKLRHYSSHILDACLNLSGIYQDTRNFPKASAYLDTASVEVQKMNYSMRRMVEKSYSVLFEKKGNFKEAYLHYIKYANINDTIFEEDKINALADVQEKYESEKKAKEIGELKVKNLDAELQTERVKRTRNAMYAGAGLLLIALFFIVNRFRIVRKNRNQLREKNVIIEYERKRSEELLLNILPEEIAEELKQKGEAEAKLVDQVTVLFTDFKGFTAMAENSSAKELVQDIHECFSAFDTIMEKYNIEKIKTIGDAYMAAGGLPTPNDTHAMDVIQAALEICQFIEEGKQRKIAMGRPFFEIRVGVHTGPVVAGIVGLKKFAYDIWGDTVNTASRMESSGEVGKVNISDSTYQLVKDSPLFTFEERGLIKAKNKGDLAMYFVEVRKK